MKIEQVDVNQAADLFEGLETASKKQFIANLDQESKVDLSTTETTTIQSSTTDSTTETTTQVVNADLADDSKPGRKPKYNFTDTAGYFEDRIKTGKFLKIEEEIDGVQKVFIPKTPEEMDEFFELQINSLLENKKKEIEETWYKDKSPAWQTVAKYAEMVDDPSEILNFVQTIKNFNSVKDIDENDLEGAEKIVRLRLEQRGEPEDVIQDQIESLKATDKLLATASKIKPIILQNEASMLQQEMETAKKKQDDYFKMVSNIRDNAIKTIEEPFLGKQKLKNEEKAVIYDLIAVPSKETGGYKIYNEIDNLFEQGNFKLLSKIALLISKEESLANYLSLEAVNKNALQLERKLRVSGNLNTSHSDEIVDDNLQPVIQRKKFDAGFKTR